MVVRGLYTVLLFFLSPFLLYRLYRKKNNKPQFGSRWKEHFGQTPPLNATHKPLWIHAVSVGECVAATPLIKALKRLRPEQPIIVTTTTSTGAEQIEKLGNLVEHRYMPLDFRFAIKGFLKVVAPKKMLIIETELWPNTLQLVHKAGIPIIVINARLSAKSRANYARIQPLFNLIHPTISKILCQSQADANRFADLGVENKKLEVTGSIKFDVHISDKVRQEGKSLRSILGIERPVWIAASTHKGEEEQILDAHQTLLKSHPTALLLFVPRHPERFDSVFELCTNRGFNTMRRTSKKMVTPHCQIYLGDTMGEMLILLGAADVCFMGGSLIGDKVGGHNVLEPATLGIPIIMGPSYYNFKEIIQSLLTLNAIKICCDSSSITTHIDSLIQQHDLRHQMSAQALQLVNANRGALEKSISHICEKI